MVYNYLFDLYRELDKRKETIEMLLTEAANDAARLKYQKGRLTAIEDFREFLITNYHSKLPRRMQMPRK